ncbi:hypothetical protein PI124_g5143 [Phytophthora idaei]|nr:hypothetical protein PI124_g5143 [Phytophthora idaei]
MITFTVMCGRRRLTTTYIRQFEEFVYLLVLNFPALTRRFVGADEARYKTVPRNQATVAEVTGTGPCVVNALDEYTGAAPTDAENQARLMQILQDGHSTGTKIAYLHPHPRLTRLVCLWVGRRRWSQPRSAYKHKINSGSRTRVLAQM